MEQRHFTGITGLIVGRKIEKDLATYYFAGFGDPEQYEGQDENFPLKITTVLGPKIVGLFDREDIMDCVLLSSCILTLEDGVMEVLKQTLGDKHEEKIDSFSNIFGMNHAIFVDAVRQFYDDEAERDNPPAEIVAAHLQSTMLEPNIFGPLFEYIKKLREIVDHLRKNHWFNDRKWKFCNSCDEFRKYGWDCKTLTELNKNY